MKLSELIEQLIEIREEYGCADVEVSVMQEHDYQGACQIESKVTDVAVSVRSVKGVNKGANRVIIIGQEIE